jgi:hypothetical protein
LAGTTAVANRIATAARAVLVKFILDLLYSSSRMMLGPACPDSNGQGLKKG